MFDQATVTTLVLALIGIGSLIIALHRLGEAKDRWIRKLSASRLAAQLVSWSSKSTHRLAVTIIGAGLIGAVIGFIILAGMFWAVRKQIIANRPDLVPSPYPPSKSAPSTSQGVTDHSVRSKSTAEPLLTDKRSMPAASEPNESGERGRAPVMPSAIDDRGAFVSITDTQVTRREDDSLEIQLVVKNTGAVEAVTHTTIVVERAGVPTVVAGGSPEPTTIIPNNPMRLILDTRTGRDAPNLATVWEGKEELKIVVLIFYEEVPGRMMQYAFRGRLNPLRREIHIESSGHKPSNFKPQ